MNGAGRGGPAPAGAASRPIRRYLLIVAAAVGLTTGMPATMFYSLGAFIPHLQADFGWSRGDISAAITIMTVGMFAVGALTGRLCDRLGAAGVGAGSLAAYGVVTIVMGATLQSRAALWAFYLVIALLGTGSTSIVLVRPVVDAFEKRRGLALGLALTGAGMAAFWVPIATQWISEREGWRAAYQALGASAVLAAPVVWLAFRPYDRIASTRSGGGDPGLSASEARRTTRFWLLTAVTLTMAAGVAGLVFHLVPLFLDKGVDAATAARLASIVGLTSTAGRLVVGWLLDRFAPAIVAGAVLSASAVGAVLLRGTGLEYAWLSTALLGLAAGAEVDLIAFLTARYFGRRSYGAIYGWLYSVFALGYGFAPLLVGMLRDRTGSYSDATLASAVLVAFAAGGMFVLARRRGAGERYAEGAVHA